MTQCHKRCTTDGLHKQIRRQLVVILELDVVRIRSQLTGSKTGVSILLRGIFHFQWRKHQIEGSNDSEIERR